MTPKPQEQSTVEPDLKPLVPDEERVVISGVSGLFPSSHHVKDLSNILYNKINPISSKNVRYSYNHPEASQFGGIVPELDRFDAQFFKINYWSAKSMDSMSRKILEQSYQAIYDAGLNPELLSGKKVGVYIGSSFSETEKIAIYFVKSRHGLGISGCCKSMFANRISYWLNAKGPSMSIDEACCSSIAALEQAYLAITRGDCEAAIVGGTNLCLHPQSSVHYARIMKLSTDGKTRSFDQNADGCIKSEAINVLFLQKAKNALRIYADVMHVKSEFTSLLTDATGPKFGFYRDPVNVRSFLTNFYNEAKVKPQEVQYVEAFGCAVPEADKAELEAIGEIFCENRENELLVGSVMSNIGYGEAASGVSAVTKILLGYESGKLAANLNCTTPRNDIPAIKDGKMKIVTEHERFKPTYTAVNSMSLSGVNAHILLHGRYKSKDLNRYKTSIPELVAISARQDSGVKRILTDLKTRPVDAEELALLRNIYQTRIAGHMGRGYIVLGTNERNGQSIVVSETVHYFDDAKRPLWFVYSGMGSQWTGMGKELMKIPMFAASIQRCHRVLEPKGVDIVDILTSSDKTMFDNILHSFVGIAAVQIGLTDVLKEIGIVPDNIIGHSVGELGCAYADGCFTAEEMILSAYSRGLVSLQTPFIKGSMAAVGLGFQQIKKLCPPGIEVACHNSAESSTISGPAEDMKQFVAELTAKGIFAKEVPCSNIAYHSKYITEAGSGLLKYLREVIKSPKPRSERWLSTSVPQEKWTDPLAQYSSAEYHTNNLLNPVLFEETSALIPSNAVLVEIAPHSLLQAILKRSLPSTCKHIALTRRGHPDNSHMVLDGVGKLFMEGYNPKIGALYPKVEFPVSTGTPMLNHLIEWAHHEQWGLPLDISADRKHAASSKFIVSLHDDEHKYIQGNIIRGKTMFPFAACLVVCWDTLAMSLGVQKKQLSVQFMDLKFYAQPTMHDKRQLRLYVTLHRGTGRFEIMDEDYKVATGFIVADASHLTMEFSKEFESDDDLVLDQDEVYQLFNERDYGYKYEFRSIQNSNSSFTNAQITWNNNWITFIDGMLQLNALRQSHDAVSEPSLITRLCINVKEHSKRLLTVESKSVAVVNVFEKHELTRCGGVIIENIKFINLPAMKVDEVAINALKFFPRFQSGNMDISTTFQICIQLVSENISKENINIIEISTLGVASEVYREFFKVIKEIPKIKVNYKQIKKEKVQVDQDLADADLILLQNMLFDDNLYQTLYNGLRPNTFILHVKPKDRETIAADSSGHYRVVSRYETNEMHLEVLKWRPTTPPLATTAVTVRKQSDIESLKAARNYISARHKLVIFSSYPIPAGLKDLVKKWRGEAEKNQVFLLTFNEQDADNIFDQLTELDLAFNIFAQGIWGGEYFVTCNESLHRETKKMLQSSRANDLESLHWVEAPEIKSSGLPVQVHFAGLNDLDVKRATGLVQFNVNKELGQTYYGMDFSGVSESGDRVMGIIHGGAASNKVIAIPELLWPVPQHWSLEDAVTVPLPYAQAFYILALKISLTRGMKILIHAGAGALGQAMISIALFKGCEVFTTVSNINKKKFLKRLFPDLKEEYIGNSRDISFGDMVMNHTDGKGVNVVVSCVKGELKNVSFKCLVPDGVLLDTNQLQTQEAYSLGMYNLDPMKNYHAVDFSSVIENRRRNDMLKIQTLIVEGIRKEYVRPLTRVTYNVSEVSRAFTLLSGARHSGRAVVLIGEDSVNVPRLVCSSYSIQVVILDDMPFGRQLCDRLISRGAKHLAVCAKTESNSLKFKIRLWQNQGVQVLLTTEVLNTERKVTSFLQKATEVAPIEAVYIVTNDAEKNEILKFFDNVTKTMSGIKHFVIISSRNEIGQEICMQRASNKLPACIIQLPDVQQVPEEAGTTSKGTVFWRNALDSIERGVRSVDTITTVAVTKHGSKKTLLEKILEKANITLPSSARDTNTLQELGLEESQVPLIASYLRMEHSLVLTDELILNLTLHKVNEMNKIISDSEFEPVKGLGNFINYVDSDELLATTEMVVLPTLTNTAYMSDDEFDVTHNYLCILPGMEGHYKKFRTLCERLKLHALVLQPGYDQFDETPKDMATRFGKLLLTKAEIKRHNKFYLMGYESGVVVALELAAILEDHGLTGTVFCVGTSPKELKCLVEKHISAYPGEDVLQDEVLRYMFKVMGGSVTPELDAALGKSSIWKEKLDACIGTLLGTVAHSSQYAKMLIESACARLKMSASYEIIPRKLKSNIVLLQAATDNPMPDTLQEHSELPISVYMLRAPLAHAVLDLRCTAVINRHLHAEVLEAFEDMNLCESYSLKGDPFIIMENVENSVQRKKILYLNNES